MTSYLTLKAEEVKCVLFGLEDRLKNCPRGERDPKFMLECLETRLAEIAEDYQNDEAILHDPLFGLDGLNRLGLILSSLALIEDEYLPAVAHQTEEERFLRIVFLQCAKRLGLNWIEDVVVHSSGRLAIFPVFLTSLSIPVIHVHTNYLDKCLCLPGVFHEFGHSAFIKFQVFYDTMNREVATHFEAMRRAIGPVGPDEKEKQIERFDEAESYWTEGRLSELFCDLLGQYVAGCANMISMIDLSMAERQPACDTNIEGYPPDAARVRVCQYAMTTNQASSEVIKGLIEEWEKFADIPNAGTLYRDACHEKLLQRFTAVVLALLSDVMKTTPRNTNVLPDFNSATAPFDKLTFEEATQRSIAVLVQRPQDFDSWWKDARQKLT
jgi:hypothetical protein